MKRKILLFLRDILFLFLFFVLVGVLIRKVVRFVSLHKQSIIHELDNILLHQLEITKRYCLQAKNTFKKMNTEDREKIDSLYKKLSLLEESYKKNSHVLVLLGPIGTISIVLKERQVKSDLFEIVKMLILISNNYVSLEKKNTAHMKDIDEGISLLQRLF